MIHYAFTRKIPDRGQWGVIKFETDDEDLYKLVETLIKTCVDATTWRNRIEEIADKAK